MFKDFYQHEDEIDLYSLFQYHHHQTMFYRGREMRKLAR